MKWSLLLQAVMKEIDDGSAEGECNKVFCPDYDMSYDERVGTTYVRQGGNNGGFGLFIKGEIEFDSPFIDDMSFYGKVAYDLKMSPEGVPTFSVAAGPLADAWDCSSSPTTDCPHVKVKDGVKKQMKEAAARLDGIIAECMNAPLGASCAQQSDCAALPQVKLLAATASQAGLNRGFTAERRKQLSDALLGGNNWTCAPISQACATLTGQPGGTGKTCQLSLRPSDVVVMPDSFSLVWYVDNQDVTGQFTGQVTAAEALYLGLSVLAPNDPTSAATLNQLCTSLSKTRARPFVRIVDNSSH